MSDFAGSWKKQKPKTLLKDPLSGPLKELDQKLSKSPPITTEDLAAISGSVKLVLKAIDDTIKAMNTTLHKESIAWVAKLRKQVTEVGAGVHDKQKKMAAYLTEVQAKRADLVKTVNVVVARPTAQVATVAGKQLKEYVAWANKEADGIYTLDGNTVAKYVSLCGDICNKIVEQLGHQPKDAGKKKEWDTEMAQKVAELKNTVPKIAKLGGLPDIKSNISHGAINMN